MVSQVFSIESWPSAWMVWLVFIGKTLATLNRVWPVEVIRNISVLCAFIFNKSAAKWIKEMDGRLFIYVCA